MEICTIQSYRTTGPIPRDTLGFICLKNNSSSTFVLRISVGELLDNRYKSYAFTGKGVFSNVIRCKDKQEDDKDVAIKIIRKNELMHKAGNLDNS